MNSTSKPQDRAPLADRLIESALGLLAEEGIEALTLRSVARRAGVSHGAPARHFRSLADLRSEVAAVGFRLLSESIEKSDARISSKTGPITDPIARLAAAGRAYVDCALANPGLFALMFRAGDLDPDNASLQRDGGAAFERLLDHVRYAQSFGWQSGREARLVAGAMWSSVHGLATLWILGAYQRLIPNASLDDAISMTLGLE